MSSSSEKSQEASMKRILTFALAIAPLALFGCRYHADEENPRNGVVATARAAIEPGAVPQQTDT